MKLAILASGTGSTSEALFELSSLVIVSDPKAPVIARVKKYNLTGKKNLPCVIIDRNYYKDRKQFGEALIEILKKHRIEFVSQNGWTVYTPEDVVDRYRGKIINAHPGPLDPGFPDFGGPKMNDLAVHQSVINFVSKIKRPFKTEIDLHLVNEQFDRGELVAIKEVEVNKDDTAEILQQRLKEVEKEFLKEFWKMIEKSGEIKVIQRPKRVILKGEEKLLLEAKKEAIEKYST